MDDWDWWDALRRRAGCGIETDFGPEHGDTFRRDLHPDLRADYLLADAPFDDSDGSVGTHDH